jgi:hypothetical protein
MAQLPGPVSGQLPLLPQGTHEAQETEAGRQQNRYIVVRFKQQARQFRLADRLGLIFIAAQTVRKLRLGKLQCDLSIGSRNEEAIDRPRN